MVFSLKSGDQGYDEDEGGQVTESIESRGTESVGYAEEHGGEWVLWVGMNQDSGPKPWQQDAHQCDGDVVTQ